MAFDFNANEPDRPPMLPFFVALEQDLGRELNDEDVPFIKKYLDAKINKQDDTEILKSWDRYVTGQTKFDFNKAKRQ